MKNGIVTLSLLSSMAAAQEVPLPPKPPDGPSLDVTMKFFKDKLNQQGQINYVSRIHNSSKEVIGDPQTGSALVSDVDANPASCMVSFSQLNVSPNARQKVRVEFSLRETEKLTLTNWADSLNRANAESGHPETTYEYIPPIFSLKVQMLQGKRVRLRVSYEKQGQQSADTDQTMAHTFLMFREEELAQRVAKAMVHAVELCGGGSKDPF